MVRTAESLRGSAIEARSLSGNRVHSVSMTLLPVQERQTHHHLDDTQRSCAERRTEDRDDEAIEATKEVETDL